MDGISLFEVLINWNEEGCQYVDKTISFPGELVTTRHMNNKTSPRGQDELMETNVCLLSRIPDKYELFREIQNYLSLHKMCRSHHKQNCFHLKFDISIKNYWSWSKTIDIAKMVDWHFCYLSEAKYQETTSFCLNWPSFLPWNSVFSVYFPSDWE